jgi:hypothetical protein
MMKTGQTYTVPGSGQGSAGYISQSRAPSPWDSGTITGNITQGSNKITNVDVVAGRVGAQGSQLFQGGQLVLGPYISGTWNNGLPGATAVVAYDQTNRVVTLSNNATVTVNGGTFQLFYPNICPSSSTFNAAFNAYSLYVLTLNPAPNTGPSYQDGLFMDSYGTAADTVSRNSGIGAPQDTIEVRAELKISGANRATPAQGQAQVITDYVSAFKGLSSYLNAHTGKSILLIPNFGDISYLYGTASWEAPYSALFARLKDAGLGTNFLPAVETLVSSVNTSTLQIPYLQSLYSDLASSQGFFLNSQTNFSSYNGIGGTTDPTKGEAAFNAFQDFILATQYLVNSPNG